MKSFTEQRAERFQRERAFEIDGETFRFKAAIDPYLWARYVDDLTNLIGLDSLIRLERAFREFLQPADVARWEETRAGLDVIVPVQRSKTEQVALYDEIIDGFLIDDDRDRWRQFRAAARDNPVSEDDLREIITYMHEVVSGRPTVPPSASGNGHSPSGTPSTDGSPSPEPTSTP